ncbi:hypothetical protein PMM47T1_18505 [Pseudomonas sp. M47T1]|nr:hypothetical protein PMM47T1_18505 [Pseudomonas sp. M47T1]
MLKNLQPRAHVKIASVTANRAFGVIDSDARPMFQVVGGISAEDALVHASPILKSAYETAYELTDNGWSHTGLIW